MWSYPSFLCGDYHIYIKSAHIKNISSYASLEITRMILLLLIFQDKYKDLDSHYVWGKKENAQKNKVDYVQGRMHRQWKVAARAKGVLNAVSITVQSLIHQTLIC